MGPYDLKDLCVKASRVSSEHKTRTILLQVLNACFEQRETWTNVLSTSSIANCCPSLALMLCYYLNCFRDRKLKEETQNRVKVSNQGNTLQFIVNILQIKTLGYSR